MNTYGPPSSDPGVAQQLAQYAATKIAPGPMRESVLRAIEMGLAQAVYDSNGRIVGINAAKSPDDLRPYTDPQTGQIVTPAPAQEAAGGAGADADAASGTTLTDTATRSGTTTTTSSATVANQSAHSSSSSQQQWQSGSSQQSDQRYAGDRGVQRSVDMQFSGADALQAWQREQLRQMALVQAAGAAAGVIGPYTQDAMAQSAGLSADALAAQYGAAAEDLRRAAADAGVSEYDAAYRDAEREAAARRLDAVMAALRETANRATEANWGARQSAFQHLGGMQFAAGRGAVSENARAGAQAGWQSGTHASSGGSTQSSSSQSSNTQTTNSTVTANEQWSQTAQREMPPERHGASGYGAAPSQPPWLVNELTGGMGSPNIQGRTPTYDWADPKDPSQGLVPSKTPNAWGEQQRDAIRRRNKQPAAPAAPAS